MITRKERIDASLKHGDILEDRFEAECTSLGVLWSKTGHEHRKSNNKRLMIFEIARESENNPELLKIRYTPDYLVKPKNELIGFYEAKNGGTVEYAAVQVYKEYAKTMPVYIVFEKNTELYVANINAIPFKFYPRTFGKMYRSPEGIFYPKQFDNWWTFSQFENWQGGNAIGRSGKPFVILDTENSEHTKLEEHMLGE